MKKTVDAIKDNYFRYICPNNIYLLNTCDRYYDEMMHYNVKMGKWNDLNIYDHKMIYILADWLKENRDYDCIRYVIFQNSYFDYVLYDSLRTKDEL